MRRCVELLLAAVAGFAASSLLWSSESVTRLRSREERPFEEPTTPAGDPFDGESSRPSCEDGARRFDKSQVVVLVPVKRDADLRHAYATWYPYAETRAFFVGNCTLCNYSLPDDDRGLAFKVRGMFMDALTRYPDVQFFMKMDVDTYFVPECLFDFLGRLNASEALYVGFDTGEFLYGGSGFVLSRAALERTNNFTGRCAERESYSLRAGDMSNAEDIFMGRCMKWAGVPKRHSNRFFFTRLDDVFGNHTTESPWHHQKTPEYVPSHGLITLHNYKKRDDYVAVHAALRFLHVP